MALSDAVGLIFKIQSDSSQASKDLTDFRKKVDDEVKGIKDAGKNAFTDLAKDLGLSAEQTAKLSAALPVLGTAIAGVTAVAVGAGVALFAMAKQASDLGSELYDAQQKTGLSAEALSALKFAAEQSGSSFEAVTTSTAKFAKLLGQAVGGSKEAQKTLKELGVTSTDLDTALGQVYKTINSANEGFQQITLSQKAFGKSGADFIPVIRGMNGDLQETIKTAKKFGLVLTEEDIRAADAFGDTLGLLSTQAKITSAKFALEFAPAITDAMGDISKSLSDNQGDIKKWGGYVNDAIRGTIDALKELNEADNSTGGYLKKYLLNIAGIKGFIDMAAKKGAAAREAEEAKYKNVTRAGYDSKKGVDYMLPGDRPRQTDEQLQQAQREAAAKAEFAARQKLAIANLAQVQQSLKDLQDITTENFKNRHKTAEQFRTDYLENEKQFTLRLKQLTAQKFDEEIKNEENATARQALEVQKRSALDAIDQDSKKRIRDANKLISDEEIRQSKEKIDAKKAEIAANLALEVAINSKTIAEREANRASLSDLIKVKQGLEAIFEQTEKRPSDKNSVFQVIEDGARINIELIGGYLLKRKQALAEELTYVKAGSQEETRIKAEQAQLNEAIEETYYKYRKERNELLKTQVETVEKLLESLGVALSSTGTNDELARFNKQLSDPDITAAIKARAEAYGYTADELKELLRLIFESRKAAEGSKRPRVVGEQPERGEDASAGEDSISNWDAFAGPFKEFFKDLESDKTIQNATGALAEFGNIGVQVMRNMTAAVGDAIAGWALYGDSIGKAFKKALAAELAHVAGIAAVKALYSTALGFLRLAEWDLAAAGHAFVSAGLWAALAGGSALAARALSPSNAGSNAFAGATASNATSGSVSNETRLIDEDRIQRGAGNERDRMRGITQRMEVTMKIPQGSVDRGLIDAINNRTAGHEALLKLIEEN